RDRGQGRGRALLRAAVPAGAVPDRYRGVSASREDETPRLVTELPGPRARELIERDRRVTSPSLARAYPLVPARGAGCVIEDVDGNRFLDLNAGIAVASTGHAHPDVVRAIERQARELLHYSGTDFYLPIYSEVCERLDAMAPMP